jgi:hypothetical protein
VLQRYDESVDTSDKTYAPGLPREMIRKDPKKGKKVKGETKERVVRYRDGKAYVMRMGERYIIEKDGKDIDAV